MQATMRKHFVYASIIYFLVCWAKHLEFTRMINYTKRNQSSIQTDLKPPRRARECYEWLQRIVFLITSSTYCFTTVSLTHHRNTSRGSRQTSDGSHSGVSRRNQLSECSGSCGQVREQWWHKIVYLVLFVFKFYSFFNFVPQNFHRIYQAGWKRNWYGLCFHF